MHEKRGETSGSEPFFPDNQNQRAPAFKPQALRETWLQPIHLAENMPRQPRLDMPDIPQHVVQRGNNKQPYFLRPQDYRCYLRQLHESAQKYDCLVHAYVLMTNHVHLLVTPSRASLELPQPLLVDTRPQLAHPLANLLHTRPRIPQYHPTPLRRLRVANRQRSRGDTQLGGLDGQRNVVYSAR